MIPRPAPDDAPAPRVAPAGFRCRAFPRRTAGVLLHVTALPGSGPVGSLGADARGFVDVLAAAGFGWWQVCPLGPTGYGDSPYQALSVFAGNPYLLDLADLRARGLVGADELAALGPAAAGRVDFGRLWTTLRPLLDRVGERAAAALRSDPDFARFRREQAGWLDDWTRFSALRALNGFIAPAAWTTTTAPGDARLAAAALQFLFAEQWAALRAYAQARGVRLFGDEPIYVSADGCDAKFRPELFQLDAAGRPTAVAGVPPDYFAADGQLWGNPLYAWERHAADGFAWWQARVRHDLGLFDAIRIDHFRGIHDYWSVPAGAPNAREGAWHAGPDLAFTRALGDLPLVAEDLGLLSPGVETLRVAAGLPGMAVLQFGFGGETAGNPHYPPNIAADRLAYTGTHDNDTLVGWLAQASAAERRGLEELYGAEPTAERLVRAVLESPAVAAFVPAQDLLGLGAEARFNTPGNPQGNWSWRMTAAQRDALAAQAPARRAALLRAGRLSG
ncbi:MAG: 4-alpha-glucanotransferase [Verrucomicrobiota bacterium]|jgi:4-alpha-glucanotransferase